MKTKYGLGTVFVELTRRCNMKCPHCMRGPAQRKDMSEEVMDAIMRKMKLTTNGIGSMVLGGGENALVPHLIKMLFYKMEAGGVYPGMFSVVTNGKRFTEEFGRALAVANTRCETYLTLSDDNQHEYVDRDRFNDRVDKMNDLAAEISRFHSEVSLGTRYGSDRMRDVKRHDANSILKMGRGATEFGGVAASYVHPYDVIGDDNASPLEDDDFYVDVDGNVWPHCDLSYRFMKLRKDMCLGNVTDPDFDWFEAAVRFNARHAENFPLRMCEPGCEGEFFNESFGTIRYRDDDEKIEKSLEMIKELK